VKNEGQRAAGQRARARDHFEKTMAAAARPNLYDRRTKATFELFEELGCLRGDGDGELKITDVGRLNEEKMMAHILECVAALGEKQRVRVALKEPLKLREDGDALSPELQAARNKVFRAALNAVTKGLTHDGAEPNDPSSSVAHQLLRAFPDGDKLADGRGWLPMHWAVVADEDKEAGVTEADVMAVYKTDLMALRTHHLAAVTYTYTDAERGKFGYTPAHMLCGLEMSEKNMSLVRQLSLSDPRAFTMKAVDKPYGPHEISALHVACMSTRRTEALLRLLLQLDPSQMKSFTPSGGPLGLLCAKSDELDERQFGCLVEADSSVEVVYDGIKTCFLQDSTFKNRVQTVAKLLEINPAAAQHKDEAQENLAHQACYYSDRMAVADCIEILKLVLARHKDALKEVDDEGQLPAHHAAHWGPVEVLDFVLGKHAEAAAVVERQNLLHVVAADGHEEHRWRHNIAADEPDEHRKANLRMLCARYPEMMLQRNFEGLTPLLKSCFYGFGTMALLLCEAGGREVASTTIEDPDTDGDFYNGWLPLHTLIEFQAETLTEKLHSEVADAFRLLLRLYPEAVGIEGGKGGYKKTPYQLAVDHDLPAYYLRLLLRAAPDLDPAELRRLNWAERRMAMFVTFAAVATTPSLLARLRAENKDLVKHVVSFL